MLITKYVKDSIRLKYIDSVVIVTFVLLGYFKLNLIPEYIFAQKYHAISMIAGFIFITSSSLILKHGIITGMTMKKMALNPMHCHSLKKTIHTLMPQSMALKCR